jgi:D-alanyl-D-alanine carboxypeptidase (penicillin-binding protein 5/6)
LHHQDHVTTAFDMCLIAKRALQFSKFKEVVSSVPYKRPATNKQKGSEIRQMNALMKFGKHYDPRVLGIKTGYHSQAMHTLVAAAEHGGRTLIAVLLGCEKREERYEDARRLFDRAFEEEKTFAEVFPLGHVFSRTIVGGKTPLVAALQEELGISYFPSEKPEIKAFIHWEALSLPIGKGQKVGEVRLCDGETVVRSCALVAMQEVQQTWWSWLQQVLP